MNEIVQVQPKRPMSNAKKAGISAATFAAAVALAMPVIAKWEGKANVGYYDIVKVPTYCYGGTGPEAIVGKRYSNAECQTQLAEDTREHAMPLTRCITRDVPAPVFASLISLSFNVGPATVCRSTAVRLTNAGDFAGACRAAIRYNKAGGNIIQGLKNRREDELKLCLSGVK